MSPFERYEQLIRACAPTAVRYVGDAGGRIDDLCGRLREGRIRIMLFGAYNAGKSSLINALLGYERAKVADVPTTDRVDEYEWEGNVLLDTPGVNAPIDHEAVSLAELQRADLILFLLRQEDQDAGDVMRRVFELLEAERPLFLLVNYSDSDPEHVARVQQQLNATLIRYAQQRGYPTDALSRLPVVLMNVKTAMRARVEGKAKLQEHSGYDDFIVRLVEWLREHDSKSSYLKIMRDSIDRALLSPVRQAMKEKSSGGSGAGEVSEKIMHLERERSILRDSAHNKIRSELSLRRPEIAELIDGTKDDQVMIASLTRMGEEVAERLEDWLRSEMSSMPDLSIDPSLNVDDLDFSERGNGKGSRFGETVRDAAVDGLKKGANKEGVGELLKLGRKLKIPGLKGRWGKTLDKWAGKAAPVIQVGIALVQIGLAHRDEQKQNQAILDAAMRRNQWVDTICAHLQSGLTGSIDEALKEQFDQMLLPLKKKQEELRQASDAVERDILAWNDLANQLQEIRFD